MKFSIPLAFAAILASTIANGQGKDAEREVLAASNARFTAVFSADEDTLNRIQADDFYLVQDGVILNKAEQIARVLAFEAPEPDPPRQVELRGISFEGNIAIMTGVITITLNGGLFSTAFTEVWLRRRNTWIAKAVHYSTIAGPQPD
jgi:hypothetical protein